MVRIHLRPLFLAGQRHAAILEMIGGEPNGEPKLDGDLVYGRATRSLAWHRDAAFVRELIPGQQPTSSSTSPAAQPTSLPAGSCTQTMIAAR